MVLCRVSTAAAAASLDGKDAKSGVWAMAHAPINAVHDAVYAALP